MKIICSKSLLSENIGIVLKAVSSKTTMKILECILLTVNEYGLTLTSNDMEIAIKTSPIDCEIIETGSIALDAKFFSEIIRRMPDGNIEISTDKQNIAHISCKNSDFKIVGQIADEFPDIPEVEKESRITLLQGELKSAIKQTIFAVSPDESKPVFTGELLDIKNNTATIVALDGFRVAVRKISVIYNENEDMSIMLIVPSKALNEISKLLTDNEDDNVIIYYTDNHAMFDLGVAVVVTRLINGEFMKYESVFTDEYNTKVVLSRDELMMSLERASIIASSSTTGKKYPIKISIKSDSINIASQTEIGSNYDEIDADVEGEAIDISFNPKYLLDILKVIDEEKISMQFTSALAPNIIKAIGNDNCNYLVLPLRIK